MTENVLVNNSISPNHSEKNKKHNIENNTLEKSNNITGNSDLNHYPNGEISFAATPQILYNLDTNNDEKLSEPSSVSPRVPDISSKRSSMHISTKDANNISSSTPSFSFVVESATPPQTFHQDQNKCKRTVDVDEISRLFDENPEAFEQWLTERAKPEVISKLHGFIERRQPERKTKKTSVSSELFQQWMASSPVQKCRPSQYRATAIGFRREHLQNLDEGELFMELIRDVANELDIDVLCHKILVNVGLLTHADRGSLFLAKGLPNNRFLTAKLFDVTQTTALDEAITKARAEEIHIAFGVGIAGTVAQTKEMINIKEAYKDSRFNCEIDLKTGYKTNAILSMPICNYEGDVIGVAQIINKTNGLAEFDDHDIEIFRRYLTFCGIGIQNAQLFEMSVQEYRRNQILLNLARSIFEEQNNLECLVTKIMTEARELLKCERCAVFLVDLDCCEALLKNCIFQSVTSKGALLIESVKNLKEKKENRCRCDL